MYILTTRYTEKILCPLMKLEIQDVIMFLKLFSE